MSGLRKRFRIGREAARVEVEIELAIGGVALPEPRQVEATYSVCFKYIKHYRETHKIKHIVVTVVFVVSLDTAR